MAAPLSLATTHRISVDFFSYGYLDVSVRHVRSFRLLPLKVSRVDLDGFPHSEIHGLTLVCQLPVAYRRLPYSSSADCSGSSSLWNSPVVLRRGLYSSF